MSAVPAPPALTPQFCFSTVALRDFLRISRSSVDDSITQNLNVLVTPAAKGFEPSSTASRTYSGHRRIDAGACQSFKSHVLFPGWKARTDVLQYCARVAMSPDPDDPEAVARQLESEREKAKVVDDRLDPYSSRFFPRESRVEELARVVRMEQGVERIVRARTWAVVMERCGDESGRAETWEGALREWEAGQKAREIIKTD